MPDRSVLGNPPAGSPSLDLQLTWRGTSGRLRVYADRVLAETSYERDTLTNVPMDLVRGWRVSPCDFDAVCVEFETPEDTFRVLLDTTDEAVARLALRRVLGEPLAADA